MAGLRLSLKPSLDHLSAQTKDEDKHENHHGHEYELCSCTHDMLRIHLATGTIPWPEGNEVHI